MFDADPVLRNWICGSNAIGWPTPFLPSLRDEAACFDSKKLSRMDGLVPTATHFRLKTYKENGFIFEETQGPERLVVSP